MTTMETFRPAELIASFYFERGVSNPDRKVLGPVFEGAKRYRTKSRLWLDLPNRPSDDTVPSQRLSRLLAAGLGVVRIESHAWPVASRPLWFARPVPSGGGAYPYEVYVYVRDASVAPIGIYHYDVGDHALVPLRIGSFDEAFAMALGSRPHGALLLCVSGLLWKNHPKYRAFGYRLVGLDIGVVTGHLHALGQRLFGSATPGFLFDDAKLAALLGLEIDVESVYSTVDVGASIDLSSHRNAAWEDVPASSSPGLDGPRSEAVKHMHRSSLMKAPVVASELPPARALPHANSATIAHHRLPLPRAYPRALDVFDALPERGVAGTRFLERAIQVETLAALLQRVIEPLTSDCRSDAPVFRGVHIGVIVNRVHGVKSGSYFYDADAHALALVRAGDVTSELARLGTQPVPDLTRTAACIAIIAETSFHEAVLGLRGYRIQQMEVGIIGQRVDLGAAALGIGSHVLCGYFGATCDELFGLAGSPLSTRLIVPVGHVRPRTLELCAAWRPFAPFLEESHEGD